MKLSAIGAGTFSGLAHPLPRILPVVTLLAVLAYPGGATTNAEAAFRKLASLAGQWEGQDAAGNAVRSSFKLIAGDTAVMETLAMPGMDEMVTLYSVDGDAIALMHYCPTGNQPRMHAHPAVGALKNLEFKFEGAGNLPSLATGHEQRLVIEFVDRNHIIEDWTWRKNGKDTEMVYRLTRKLK